MLQKIFKLSNWKKTYYYLKKNGFKAAVYAALERLEKSENDDYDYQAPDAEEWKAQREECQNSSVLFSILVPVYRTPEKYFREMIQSVIDQSYPNWELLLGDASPDEGLREIVDQLCDSRVKYIKIAENKGISANTNVILKEAEGDYIGLLDHDDVLTSDALYSVYQAILERQISDNCVGMIYSDEDKGDGEMEHFYDLNNKPAFDQDYLWSNNYICHFTVMKAELMKRLGFRTEFDGAQDFDIFLRAARELHKECNNTTENSQVVNISKVLYHWRCHVDSTAVNPQSKLYAYEAGKKAVEEDLQARGIKAQVSHSRHLGFYRVDYEDIFRDRPEVAMVLGPVYRGGRIVGGARDEKGRVIYEGLLKGFSGGHLHRASTWQKCYAGDFTHAVFREELLAEFLKTQGIAGREWLYSQDQENRDRLCMAWADYVHDKDMIILYDPDME